MKLVRRKGLWVVALILGAPAVLLTAEHLHGRWRLARWQHEMMARGEKLAIEECLPAAQPQVENRHRDLMAACGALRAQDLSKLAPPSFFLCAPGSAVPLRLLNQWPSNWNGGKTLKEPGRTNVTWQMLGEELARGSNSLAEAKGLLHEPRLDPELDYHQGFNLLLPHLAPLKVLGRDLSIAAVQELHEGRLDPALDDIKDVLRVAAVLEEERTIIAQLVRQAMVPMAVGATWQALQEPGWRDEQLADLQHTWESLEFLEPMSRAYEMERAVSIELFERMRGSVDAAYRALNLTGGFVSPAPSQPIASFSDLLAYFGNHSGDLVARGVALPIWQFAWSREDECHYLGWTQHHLDVIRASARARSGVAGRDVGARSEEGEMRSTGLSRFRHIVSSVLASALDRSTAKTISSEGQKELVVAAIALERYRLRHGQPAASLEQLVPAFLAEVPQDYWDGAPLRYRIINGVPLLYATGQDAKDDGGDPTPTQGRLTSLGILSGRDVVWPNAATPEQVAAAGGQ